MNPFTRISLAKTSKSALIGMAWAFSLASASGALVSVVGPVSTSGFSPEIIMAPGDTRNNATPFSRQVGFNENQGVLLTSTVAVDGGGSLAAGLIVNSHMIYLERLRGQGQPASVVHTGVEWTFDGPILGVLSSINGGREAASRAQLGLEDTRYAAFPNRGMEANDNYTISGDTLTVNMRVTEPGDWIRVVTLAPTKRKVPETGGWMLGGIAGLALTGVRRWCSRSAKVA